MRQGRRPRRHLTRRELKTEHGKLFGFSFPSLPTRDQGSGVLRVKKTGK